VRASRCRIVARAALAAAGDGNEARRVLRRASAELEARDAWGYRDDALRVLRRLGDRPRPVSNAGRRGGGRDARLDALTRREREVPRLVAGGQANAQIDATLRLTESTVEKRLSSVLAKLEVPTRAGVIRLLAGQLAASR
jgi:DNA-binding NarL/FixJ family response regulator